MTNTLIKWGAYPTIFLGCSVLQYQLLALGLDLWFYPILVSAMGITSVAILERIQPYESDWNQDHDDTIVDVMHAAFSLTLIFAVVHIATLTRSLLPTEFDVLQIWPLDLPLWAQLLGAGLIIDFGLWFMHWLSHKNEFLWRLHALHHSSKRLYWLNGERRHPLSAIVLASPGLIICILIGVPAEIIACWFAIISVHLAFQHANLDYSVGIFRHLVGVAEIHRWHHKREYEDAQVNFGEFWVVWDKLFGTFHASERRVQASEVGLSYDMPRRYVAQLLWPFEK